MLVSRRGSAHLPAAEGALAAASAVTSLAIAAWSMRIWAWRPGLPLEYRGDSLLNYGVIKATLDHGWYLSNPELGAPAGAELHDFPFVSNDALQLVIIKAMGLLSHNPFTVAALFYLLTFLLGGAIATLVMRWRGVGRVGALVGGVAFGVMPLHFMKGIGHLFLSSYYMVPVSCGLALAVLAGDRLLRPVDEIRRARRWLGPRLLGAAAVVFAIAGSSVYYAVFAVILLLAATLAAAAGRRWASAVEGTLLTSGILASIVLLQLPTVLYRAANGPNSLSTNRSPTETEYFALKLIQLVMPIPGHRIPAFAGFTDRYLGGSRLLGEPSTAVGTLGVIGLAAVALVAFGSMVPGIRERLRREDGETAFLAGTAFIVATTGGVSALIGYALTSQIRAWSRMCVVLGFLGLLMTSRMVDRLLRRLPSGNRVPVAIVVSLMLLAVITFDQTSPAYRPDVLVMGREAEDDRAFVAQIEARVPRGSAILQLPYVAFPESPANYRLIDYDQLRPYLHSQSLRWSYGTVKGRPGDWHEAVHAYPLGVLLAGVATAGFSGVLIDRYGYGDGGAGLEAGLLAHLGAPLVRHQSQRFSFYGLTDLAQRTVRSPVAAEAAEATLRPVTAEAGQGTYAEERGGPSSWRWATSSAEVDVYNPSRLPRAVDISVDVSCDCTEPKVSTFVLPDGSIASVILDSTPARLQRTVILPPGESKLVVNTSGPPTPRPPWDPQQRHVRLTDLTVLPVVLCQLAVEVGALSQPAGLCTGEGHPQVGG